MRDDHILVPVRSVPDDIIENLYADADGITVDAAEMKWADAEWVSYAWERKIHTVNGVPVVKNNTLVFAIGRGTYHEDAATDGPCVEVAYKYMGGSEAEAQLWRKLVALSGVYLEPRLTEVLLGRVRREGRVNIGNPYCDVDSAGIYYGEKLRYRPWRDVMIDDEPGSVSIGPAKGIWGGFALSKSYPNTVLIPRLHDALASAEDKAHATEASKDPVWLKWVISGVVLAIVLYLALALFVDL